MASLHTVSTFASAEPAAAFSYKRIVGPLYEKGADFLTTRKDSQSNGLGKTRSASIRFNVTDEQAPVSCFSEFLNVVIVFAILTLSCSLEMEMSHPDFISLDLLVRLITAPPRCSATPAPKRQRIYGQANQSSYRAFEQRIVRYGVLRSEQLEYRQSGLQELQVRASKRCGSV